jgi:hypothetical protein
MVRLQAAGFCQACKVRRDAVDRQIIHALTVQPRAAFRTLAQVVGVSDQTAARRYRRLRESAGLRVLGLVRGAQAGWVDWMVRLQTTPGGATAIADALARRPDTRWVRLFSGGTEIVCVLQARTPEQRDTLFLHGLPGSRRVVQISAYATMHVFSPVQRAGMTNALSPATAAAIGITYPSETHCSCDVLACVTWPIVVSATLTEVIGTYVTNTPSTARATVSPS